MSENLYLHHFSAQVSQIVLLPYLTVLPFITTVWPETSDTHKSAISVNNYYKSFS